MNNPFNLHFARLHIPHCTWKYHFGVPLCTCKHHLGVPRLHIPLCKTASITSAKALQRAGLSSRPFNHLQQFASQPKWTTAIHSNMFYWGKSFPGAILGKDKEYRFHDMPFNMCAQLVRSPKETGTLKKLSNYELKSLHWSNIRHPKVTKILVSVWNTPKLKLRHFHQTLNKLMAKKQLLVET